MNYYVLANDGGSYNLETRTVYYDREANAAFRIALTTGKRCEGMDFAALDYLGGKKPRFEDMLTTRFLGFMVSERFREVVEPFLASPDDVEWLYTPQRDDPDMPYPCFDRYYHFNVQRQVKPEDCLTMDYWFHERTGKHFIKTLHFNPAAAEGAHVFMLDYRLNNLFISEVVLKALKKAKLFKIIVKDVPTRMHSLAHLQNEEISRSNKS